MTRSPTLWRSAALAAVVGPALAFAAPMAVAATAAAPAACAFAAAACTAGARLPAPAGATLQPSGTSSLPAVATETAQAAATVLHDTFGWWLKTPSVKIESSGVLKLQVTLLGVAAIVMTLLVIVQGIRMIMTRRGAPFAELIRGSIIAAVVVTAGIGLIDSALVAGDRIATAILKVSFADSDQLVTRMTDVMLGDGVKKQAPTLLLMFSLIVLLTGLVQAVLLFLRQTAVPILGLLLPVAGVGQAGPPATQRWLPQLVNVLFAIVLYKPVVVIVLSVGFVQLSGGTTLLDAIRGAVTLVVSVLAFPAMLRLFRPLSVGLATRGGDGLAALGAAGGFAVARRGAGTPGDTTAVQQAAFMQGVPAGGAGGSGASGGSGGSAVSAASAAAAGGSGAAGTTSATGSGGSAGAQLVGVAGSVGGAGGSGAPGTDAASGMRQASPLTAGHIAAGDATRPLRPPAPSAGEVRASVVPWAATEAAAQGVLVPGDTANEGAGHGS